MNSITNILYLFYIHYLFDLPLEYTYIITLGMLFLYFDTIIATIFYKKKIDIYNKIFHSIPILLISYLILSFFINMNISYIKTFLLLLIGGFIHFFSDLLSNKKIHLLYPFNKKGYSLGLINYFDPYPSLIFILFNFVLTLKLNNINYLIYYIPMVFMAFYISLKYIMKNKLKNSYKTIPCGGELIIVPTFYITIWQIMVVKKNTILIINRTPFKENYLSIRFLENNYKGEYQENLKKSNNYKNFISNFPLTYSQEIERMGKKYYQVFDINNFFSLFKKEQCYYEAEVNGRDIIKEKIVI